MKRLKQLGIATVFAATGFAGVSQAAVVAVEFPMLSSHDVAGDNGMYGDGSTLFIENSYVSQTLAPSGSSVDIDGNFSLSATFDHVENGFEYYFSNGTITIENGTDQWLTAVFDEMIVNSFSGGFAQFSAELTLTGGSLYTSAVDANAALVGTVTGLTSNNLTNAFSSANVVLDLGDVSPVPLPAPVLLFGAGLVSLLGLRKRKQAA